MPVDIVATVLYASRAMKVTKDSTKTQHALQRCANPKCNEMFEPHTLAGRTKMYHSKKCKWAAWNDANPRVKQSDKAK
jgi:hypothetical protein